MEFKEYFLTHYNNFRELESKLDFYIEKIIGRYPVLKNEKYKNELCLALAHYLTVYEVSSEDTNQGGGTGIVSSASIDGVSVSYQQKPINDLFEDFFAQTIYGRDFLAFLSNLGAITLIN